MGGGAGARLGGVGRWAGVRSERQLHAAAHPPPHQGLPSPPEPQVTRGPARGTAIPRLQLSQGACRLASPQWFLSPSQYRKICSQTRTPSTSMKAFSRSQESIFTNSSSRRSTVCGNSSNVLRTCVWGQSHMRHVSAASSLPRPVPQRWKGDRDTGARRAVSSEHAAQVAARCSARPKPAYRLERDGSEKAQLPTAAVCGRTAAAAAEECVRGPAVGADVPEVFATRLERVAPCEAPRGRHPRPGRGRGRRERWRRPGRRRRRRGRRW